MIAHTLGRLSVRLMAQTWPAVSHVRDFGRSVFSLHSVTCRLHGNTVSGLVGYELISVANWLSSVLCHCWLGYLTCKDRPQNDP